MRQLIMIYVKFIFFIVGLCYGITAYSSETIQVQAEGSGTSKIEATKNAWLEAVRQAVGVYMSSKTVVLDDEITESIAAYSRGQVESYKVVKSEQNADGWHIVILANIEKDVLQEETQKVSLMKQTLEFDGTSNVANKITKEDKKKSASEVISSIDRLDFKDSLIYKAELREGKIEDKKIYYVRHYLGLDVKSYISKLAKLTKTLDKVAKTKKKYYFTTETIKSNKIASDFELMLRAPKDIFSESTIKRRSYDIGNYDFKDPPFAGVANRNDFLNLARDNEKCIAIVDSLSTISVYCFDLQIKKMFSCIIPNNLTLVFKIDDSDGVPLAVSDAVTSVFSSLASRSLASRSYRFGTRDLLLALFPFIGITDSFSTNSYVFYIDQKLDLSDEEMLNIKQISPSFEIIGEERPDELFFKCEN